LWSLLYPTVESSGWLTAAEGNIAVDGDDNVYVGVNMYANPLWEPHILKYNKEGVLLKDYIITVRSPDSQAALFGVAYSSSSKKVYAAFSYWNGERERYVVSIGMFDENLNLIKSVIGPGGIDWDYGSATGIGIDKDGNVYVGGSRSGSFIYVLKYDADLNLKFEFSKDPIAPKMYVGGETIPNGGYYIINNEFAYNTLHNISASGAEQWSLLSGLDIYIHTVDVGGNFYGAQNFQVPQISKVGYGDGAVKWTISEPHSNMIAALFVDGQDRIYTVGYLAQPVGDKDFYIARYTQGVAEKYSMAKSTGDNQIVVVSSYTAPLVSLVNIFATTTPASEIGVNFNISTYPVGAIGQELTVISTRTNQNGQAMTQLRLGNIPAEYGVTAFCPSCVPEFSSVTFTCCGKLPNDHFSQSGVPQWSTSCYASYSGNCPSNKTSIGWRGCALTSLATLINYYANTYPELHISTTNPGSLNDYLRNLPIPLGYNARNDVNFSAIERYSNGRVNFIDDESVNIWEAGITRQILIDRTNYEILAGRPVILRIRRLRENGTYGPHFIMAIGRCGSSYVVVDPMGGVERLYNPTDPNALLQGIRVFRPFRP